MADVQEKLNQMYAMDGKPTPPGRGARAGLGLLWATLMHPPVCFIFQNLLNIYSPLGIGEWSSEWDLILAYKNLDV